jgi:4-hydroxybenzoate polyprenyltransferase
VVSLIAGISLLDALLIAGAGSPALAGVALAGFGVTLFFQRYISGT